MAISLSLEEKVAQIFLLGSDTGDLTEEIESFYRYGLGGLLLFRHHTQPFSTALGLKTMLSYQQQQFKGAGLSFISIDQEGGQVERLPHWYFPNGVLPMSLGLKQDVVLCEAINAEVAKRLRWLGINVNFTPTVDLNRERLNPIIGARAYGKNTEEVIPFALAVMKSHLAAGVLPVAKHFPGHGSGTVDSHLTLPVFENWAEVELQPYEALIKKGLPAIMIAHGLYPQLAKQLEANPKTPASVSKGIITKLLRSQMDFNGLVFTDDLTMGAVHTDTDPLEVALQALTAGADMLVYRTAQPEACAVFQALCARTRQGKLSESLIDEKLTRILEAKSNLDQTPVPEMQDTDFSEASCQALSLRWANQCLIELKHQFISPLPITAATPWGLIYPDRNTMVHYKPDQVVGSDLPAWCAQYDITPKAQVTYPVFSTTPWALPDWEGYLETLVFVAFNSLRDTYQQAAYHRLKQQYPNAKMILVSCGMPNDNDVLFDAWVHVALPSFRPSAMEALVQWLVHSLMLPPESKT